MAETLPLFNMMIIPGIRGWLDITQFVAGKNYMRFANTSMFTRVEAWLNDNAAWESQGNAALWLEFCRDGDAVAALTEPPLWDMRLYRDDASHTLPKDKYPENIMSLPLQPLESGNLDIQFRHTQPYPNGTIFKPIAPLVFTIKVEGYSVARASGNLLS